MRRNRKPAAAGSAMGIKKYQGLGTIFVSECSREVDERRGTRLPALSGAQPIVTIRPAVKSPFIGHPVARDWRREPGRLNS
jgi:hypothetical protein